ncbi:bifunctional 5,10-methylenetetrahydrofolate dehydrogenase/5,10-methenyltetrahydrofolate cyclohydrolase [Candidatus Saccharibacteria bacterium]|nr:bifunctional 5,10-methylenetetrahydrofolate dehydrogenase/5,10-methenyltetrahydrofolate cyclohydrolase [Candidatus Saccharibacteria bacterium]
MSAMAKIIDGNKIAQVLMGEVRLEVAKLKLVGKVPKLVIISYNPSLASKTYVGLKLTRAKELGVECEVLDWTDQSLDVCVSAMAALSIRLDVDGIIVQLPVRGLNNYQELLNAIPASKDVDGLSDESLAMLRKKSAEIIPATPRAILELMTRSEIELNGKRIAIIGQGKLVGLPLSIILKNKHLDVATLDINTTNASQILKSADVVIAAAGEGNLLTGAMIKAGAIVLDAGTSEQNGKLVGDVDYASVELVASVISKVPGGIGPVTVVCMLQNVIEAAKNS